MKKLRMLPILLAFLSCGLLSIFISNRQVLAQDEETGLVLLIRDITAEPLEGVRVSVYENGPPHVYLTTCTTGQDGTCFVPLPYGVYLIRFEDDWQGMSFTRTQNDGILSDGSISGFNVFYDGGNNTLSFVIGANEQGQLVPQWDVSRDPNSDPIIHTDETPSLHAAPVDDEATFEELDDDPDDLKASQLETPAADSNVIIVQADGQVADLQPTAQIEASPALSSEPIPDETDGSVLFAASETLQLILPIVCVTSLVVIGGLGWLFYRRFRQNRKGATSA